eukprot:4405739-Alexandrium_andersonii.AAC.1
MLKHRHMPMPTQHKASSRGHDIIEPRREASTMEPRRKTQESQGMHVCACARSARSHSADAEF